MKSREGTVVDADDLMDQDVETARITSGESAKLEDMLPGRKKSGCMKRWAWGALKYFILKVDPRKTDALQSKRVHRL